VLEQVRKSGTPGPLILRADVIPDGDVRDRRRVVLRENHAQAVRKGQQLILELRRMNSGAERRGDGRQRKSTGTNRDA
jgi:hypothetical protein